MTMFTEAEILVRGRLTLSTVEPGAAVVSISDKPDDWPKMPDGCLASLKLHFHDVEVGDDMFEREPGKPVVKAFTEAQAAEVAAFVKGALYAPTGSLKSVTTRLLVFQCEAGISRSSAMAAATARWLRSEDMPYFRDYLPNRLVYRLTLQALWGCE